jgi:hypothetical protein
LAKRADEIAHALPDSLEDLHIQQQRQALELAESPELRVQKLLADAWCAAFMQPKTAFTRSTAITQAVLERFGSGTDTLDLAAAEEMVDDLARQYRFFHWHVEFPHIFRVGNGARDIDPATGWAGGFSCVLGNPPWERVKFQEQEFFAARQPKIATAANAARKKLIAALADSNSPADRRLFDEFQAELRIAADWSHFFRESGRYPLTGHGDINTYAVFAETARTVTGAYGRLGIIVPTGIATDQTTSPFFREIVKLSSLASLYDFQTGTGLWSRIGHARFRFCLLTLTGSARRELAVDLAFFLRSVSELERSGVRFSLKPDEIALLSPNTGTCPVFRSQRDAELTLAIYKRVPVLVRDGEPNGNPWKVHLARMFDISNDANSFHTREQLEAGGWILIGNTFFRNGNERMLPMYEGRMGHQFNHRFASLDTSKDTESTISQLEDSCFVVLPQYWITEAETEQRLSRRLYACKSALLGHRRVARSSDERSCIAAIIPWGAASYGWILSSGPSAHELACLAAAYNSFAYDYLLRNSFSQASVPQSTSEQVPVPSPGTFLCPAPWKEQQQLRDWIRQRVIELAYTAYDMEGFARDLGDDGAPFRWDEQRRFGTRAELDAAFFHLYGIERDDVDYIMETFPIVKRKDEQRYGSFRTKELILDAYDAMAEAMRTGMPYQTILDPSPGHGPRHPARRNT